MTRVATIADTGGGEGARGTGPECALNERVLVLSHAAVGTLISCFENAHAKCITHSPVGI